MNGEQYVIFHSTIQSLLRQYIYPMPHHDLINKVKVFCYLQQLYWDYLDYHIPKFTFLPKWSEEDFICFILRYTGILQPYFKHEPSIEYKEWSAYVETIPVYGSVIVDSSRKWCLLLKVKFDNSVYRYGFPKGKINVGETPIDCAIRETKEEIGLDISSSVYKDYYVEDTIHGKFTRLYIVEGVSKKTKFKSMYKGECDGYEWMPIRKIKMGIKWRGICKQIIQKINKN